MGLCQSQQDIKIVEKGSPLNNNNSAKPHQQAQNVGNKAMNNSNNMAQKSAMKKQSKKQQQQQKQQHRKSTESNESGGLQMRPVNVEAVEEVQLELLKLSKEEIQMLFVHFEDLKKHRDVIARDIHAGLKEKVPGAIEKMDTNQTSDNWEKIPQSVVLLSGVERCLLRMGNKRRLDEFLRKLVTGHIKHFGVPQDMLLAGLDVTGGVVLKHLGKSHQPQANVNITTTAAWLDDDSDSKHIWQNCTSCSTWARFFELLHKTLEELSLEPQPPEEALATAAVADTEALATNESSILKCPVTITIEPPSATNIGTLP